MYVATDDGVRLHVVRLGTRSTAPPLVFVHGLFGNLAMWYMSIAPAFAESREVILYDFRGHGLSDDTRGTYDLETMTGDLDGLIDELGAAEVDLVGYSYGGCVAFAYALRSPDRVRRLAVLEMPLGVSRRADFLQFTLARRGVGAVMDLLSALPKRARAVRRGTRRGRHGSSLAARIANSLRTDFRQARVFDDARLSAFQVPLLGVYGGRSRCRIAGERLTRTVASGRYVQVDAGHFVCKDAPGPTLSALQRFFDE